MRQTLLYPALAAVPLAGLGLWLWAREGTGIWLSDFMAACF